MANSSLLRPMRLLIGLFLLYFAGTSAVFAADFSADAINGIWQTKTGGYVQVYPDGQIYTGRIVGSTDGKARYDTQNPNPSEKGRRLLGVVILKGLKPEGNGHYDSGTIYDPNNGKTYSVEAHLTSQNALAVRGYVGFSMLGKTQTWHRIDPDAPHVHHDLLRAPLGNKNASQQ